MTTRRSLLGASLGGGAWLAARCRAALPLGAAAGAAVELAGPDIDLVVGRSAFQVDGRRTSAVTVNGRLPGPLLRWREGDEVSIRVTNTLDEDTSIHWHGILLPFQMDGVPGVSFPGIAPGATFTYRFPVRQAGTYWYHSHSNLQEQSGHYGALVIEPRGADPVVFDREYVVVLSDWTDLDPHRLFGRLKRFSAVMNDGRRTAEDLVEQARREGWSAALGSRLEWGAMRMSPTDIADLGAGTYTYLLNGRTAADNWTALFRPGERVRLRLINASAMTLFNVRIPGLALSVVQADGTDVYPVEVDELQIGVAETYDVVVVPEASAYTLMCETADRSGFVRATLAPRAGMAADVPALRSAPLLTMKDMGMAGTGAGHADSGGGHVHHHVGAMEPQPHHHPQGPGVDNLAMHPLNRLHEPGVGLGDVPHRALCYADLRSLAPNADLRDPEREIELHLTGNMERYMWSFDGETFSAVVAPIVFHQGERLRLTLVNDSMMSHPIHLHGMFFDVVLEDAGDHRARKHTIVVKPGEKLAVDVSADAPGPWAFHCHLLYHMHAGMFRVVSVRPRDGVSS